MIALNVCGLKNRHSISRVEMPNDAGIGSLSKKWWTSSSCGENKWWCIGVGKTMSVCCHLWIHLSRGVILHHEIFRRNCPQSIFGRLNIIFSSDISSWGVWLGRHICEIIAQVSKEQLKENRNLLLTKRGKAALILIFSKNTNHESVAYRSLRRSITTVY